MSKTSAQPVLRILLIEDDVGDVLLTRRYLDQAYSHKYELDHVSSVAGARDIMSKAQFDVLLVDLNLGGDSGIDFVHEAIRDLNFSAPIILFTGQDDHETDVLAMEAGATDYLVKGDIDAKTLERSIRYSLKQKNAEARIQHQAYHDNLTELPNRLLFFDRLNHALTRLKRNTNHGAILFLDLDNFKTINDTLGHATGDALLIETANSLNGEVRDEDTVARLGGDEFVVLLSDLSPDIEHATDQARIVAEKIRLALNEPKVLEESPLKVGSSIGISLFQGKDIDADTVLKQADSAMYDAKKAGRNTICLFSNEIEDAMKQSFS